MDKSKTKTPEGQVQGEGDYVSSRRYRDEVKDFIGAHDKDIPQMADDAEKAIDADTNGELKRAEDKGKAKARH